MLFSISNILNDVNILSFNQAFASRQSQTYSYSVSEPKS